MLDVDSGAIGVGADGVVDKGDLFFGGKKLESVGETLKGPGGSFDCLGVNIQEFEQDSDGSEVGSYVGGTKN